MTRRDSRPILCRLGLHSRLRTQGLVGYCTRPGCTDLRETCHDWMAHGLDGTPVIHTFIPYLPGGEPPTRGER